MADRTGLGGPAALGDFALINGLYHDAFQEGSGGKLVWRPRAIKSRADRLLGYTELGDVSGTVNRDIDVGVSRNFRANLTANTTFVISSTLGEIGLVAASIKTNGFVPTFTNAIFSGASPTWTSPSVHDTKLFMFEG